MWIGPVVARSGPHRSGGDLEGGRTPAGLRGAVVLVLGGLPRPSSPSPAVAAPAQRPTRPASRGPIVVGAEQEPDCADWIDACAGESWGLWTMQEETMPRVFDMVRRGGQWVYSPSVLMAAPPALSTVDGAQVVTYQHQPEGRLVRRRADHLDRLPSTRGTRSPTAPTSSTGPATTGSPPSTTPTPTPRSSPSRPPSPGGVSSSAATTACSPATSSPATTATTR